MLPSNPICGNHMEFVFWTGLFFLTYPIIIGVFFSRANKARYESMSGIIAELRQMIAELRSKVTRLESDARVAQLAKDHKPAPAASAEAKDRDVAHPSPAVPPAPPHSMAASPAKTPEPAARGTAGDAAPAQSPTAVLSAAAMAATHAAAQPAGAVAPPDVKSAIRKAADDELDRFAPPPVAPAPPPAWLLALKKWLFTGNLVAKFGLLILFIGVSFLLKYVAERVTIPIELRLAGVVLADIALLAWGWRIRTSRRGIGLPVQGAALAIMMLVTFGAFQRFHLIPSGLAFSLLLALTVFTCVLAVLQNAVWLAAFGIAGGFAAPILVSTGQGSHVGLFSYYALLNAGVLAIALKRSWRLLNLLGFGFTFAVGTAWGALRYSPDNFLTSQGFLVLFFLSYVAIALAYAARQAPKLKHYVDATIVFGTPILAFGLQVGLVKDKPFGLALSALALGLFYTGLASLLWRRRGGNHKMLVDAFLAMGIVFGTLALPFALDDRWTSGAWALEGAALVWIGLRQKRVLTWAFGLLVQAGAWFSFIAALLGLDMGTAGQANIWLGFLLLTGSAFAMAINFRGQEEGPGARAFAVAGNLFLGLASLWLLAGAWTEILVRNASRPLNLGTLLVASAMATALVLVVVAKRMQWRVARAFAMIAQMAGGIALLYLAMLRGSSWAYMPVDIVPGALMIAAGALYSSWHFERKLAGRLGASLATFLLGWAAFWWFGPILNLLEWPRQLAEMVFDDQVPLGWPVYLMSVTVSALAFAWLAARLSWMKLRWLSATCWLALAMATVSILHDLYRTNWDMPHAARWSALAVLWLAGELLLYYWPANGWSIGPRWLKLLHFVRSAGPWMMIWPVGRELFGALLYHNDGAQAELLERAGWLVSGSWATYIPTWLMMIALVWLVGRSRSDRWPAKPIASWYRTVLVPAGVVWSLLLAAYWNLMQNGAMAPLPYLPVLNPLDLTTGFAAALAVAAYRMVNAQAAGSAFAATALLASLPRAAGFAAYAWFNLMLLRTAANYLGIDYRIDALMASQFVQAMLSLTWCVTALVLMRRAALQGKVEGGRPWLWIQGALLLGVVVAKLFIADLANVGSMARIVSFVGVGLLMVLIGYLAPYPSQPARAPEPVAA